MPTKLQQHIKPEDPQFSFINNVSRDLAEAEPEKEECSLGVEVVIMAATMKLFSAFLLLLFISERGVAQPCGVSNISIKQMRTGKMVEGQAEYKVLIRNNCLCSQSELLVRCVGFSTVKPVDPTIFKQVDHENCLINDGQPIVQGHPIRFKYAWKTPYDLVALKSQISCS